MKSVWVVKAKIAKGKTELDTFYLLVDLFWNKYNKQWTRWLQAETKHFQSVAKLWKCLNVKLLPSCKLAVTKLSPTLSLIQHHFQHQQQLLSKRLSAWFISFKSQQHHWLSYRQNLAMIELGSVRYSTQNMKIHLTCDLVCSMGGGRW